MASYLDMEMLADLVRAKRGRRGLRQLQKDTGVSASTIHRIENGSVPDIATFLAVCDWLEIPAYEFIKNTENKGERGDYAAICAKLRTDKSIPPRVRNALAFLIEAIYQKT